MWCGKNADNVFFFPPTFSYLDAFLSATAEGSAVRRQATDDATRCPEPARNPLGPATWCLSFFSHGMQWDVYMRVHSSYTCMIPTCCPIGCPSTRMMCVRLLPPQNRQTGRQEVEGRWSPAERICPDCPACMLYPNTGLAFFFFFFLLLACQRAEEPVGRAKKQHTCALWGEIDYDVAGAGVGAARSQCPRAGHHTPAALPGRRIGRHRTARPSIAHGLRVEKGAPLLLLRKRKQTTHGRAR